MVHPTGDTPALRGAATGPAKPDPGLPLGKALCSAQAWWSSVRHGRRRGERGPARQLALQGLRARWPGLVAQGIGGPKMQAQGFEAWWPSSKLSVFGYVDALLNLRELLSIRKQLGKPIAG